MKHLLLTTIAAVVLVGCGKTPDTIHEAAWDGNIEPIKQHLADGLGREPASKMAACHFNRVATLLPPKSQYSKRVSVFLTYEFQCTRVIPFTVTETT